VKSLVCGDMHKKVWGTTGWVAWGWGVPVNPWCPPGPCLCSSCMPAGCLPPCGARCMPPACLGAVAARHSWAAEAVSCCACCPLPRSYEDYNSWCNLSKRVFMRPGARQLPALRRQCMCVCSCAQGRASFLPCVGSACWSGRCLCCAAGCAVLPPMHSRLPGRPARTRRQGGGRRGRVQRQDDVSRHCRRTGGCHGRPRGVQNVPRQGLYVPRLKPRLPARPPGSCACLAPPCAAARSPSQPRCIASFGLGWWVTGPGGARVR
jgi:hypothetical protein